MLSNVRSYKTKPFKKTARHTDRHSTCQEIGWVKIPHTWDHWPLSSIPPHCTMHLTLHSFSQKLCSATIDLKTLWHWRMALATRWCLHCSGVWPHGCHSSGTNMATEFSDGIRVCVPNLRSQMLYPWEICIFFSFYKKLNAAWQTFAENGNFTF